MAVSSALLDDLAAERDARRAEGRLIEETAIAGPQGPWVELADGRRVLNFCSNDYLGLADDDAVQAVAAKALRRWGFGLAAGRIISGTQTQHRALESAISAFLGTDDTLLYTSCFDANGGLFEPLLKAGDAVISDALNHASIIDGIRLCKARRLTYPSRDLAELERALRATADARRRMIVTDGVFSMDGGVADLRRICDLADEHEAIVVVDDSHATGVLGPGGRGTPHLAGVVDRVDLVTGTLGKALGGAGGGFTSGRRALVETLRQTSRSYLFTNALSPQTVAVGLYALELSLGDEGAQRRRRVLDNARQLRELLAARGFDVAGGEHVIVPIMIGDGERAKRIAATLLEAEHVLAVALGFPIVPVGEARIRLQVSAAHSESDLVRVADALVRAAAAHPEAQATPG